MIDEVTGAHVVPLGIPQLDHGFRLQFQAMLATGPLMDGDLLRQVDLAALRRDGHALVATYLDLTRFGGPLAVGAPLDVRIRIRQVDLAEAGRMSRLGLEVRYGFSSLPGTGDPTRSRDVASDVPAGCGEARIILTLVRPWERPARRLVGEPPRQTAHLTVHPLPSPAGPEPVPEEWRPVVSDVPHGGVFGPHHTDPNQHVYTGTYLGLLEDHVSLLAAAADLPVAGYRPDRIAAAFRRPLRAGDRYAVRGTLYEGDGRTAALVQVAPATGGPPAVVARVDGCASSPDTTYSPDTTCSPDTTVPAVTTAGTGR
ncbi:MAG: hypothetical protein WCA46_22460 [Actinocatenispora sp.]